MKQVVIRFSVRTSLDHATVLRKLMALANAGTFDDLGTVRRLSATYERPADKRKVMRCRPSR